MSALVTLFANILQNPQDARARSDLKLMSSVVAFLTMLERDVSESNSYVRRMLSVCAEFERIAQVVLDKAERELRGRAKRKAAGGVPMTEREREKILRERGAAELNMQRDLEEGKTLEQIQIETQAPYRRPVHTPSMRASIAGSQSSGSPAASWAGSQIGGLERDHRSPIANEGMAHSHSNLLNMQRQPPVPVANGQWPPHGQTSLNVQDFMSTFPPDIPGASHQGPFNRNTAESFSSNPNFSPRDVQFSESAITPNLQSNAFTGTTPQGTTSGGSFQQPFVPQDLWQMPMTLEWDWAEGLGLGSFTPGPQAALFDSSFDGEIHGP